MLRADSAEEHRGTMGFARGAPSRGTLGNKMMSSQTGGPTDQKSTFSCTEILKVHNSDFEK
jgi:hypothetical protein